MWGLDLQKCPLFANILICRLAYFRSYILEMLIVIMKIPRRGGGGGVRELVLGHCGLVAFRLLAQPPFFEVLLPEFGQLFMQAGLRFDFAEIVVHGAGACVDVGHKAITSSL